MISETVKSEPVIQRQVSVETVTEPRVTVEKGLYALLALLALCLRFFDLGGAPLDAHEAGPALEAYRLATGAGLPGGAYSPALFSFNFATFALLGANDWLARVMPAIVGTMLVLVPFWLRPWLGRSGALATAALFALSPSFLVFSRQLDEAVVTASATLALLAAALRYTDRPSSERLLWVGVWLAVALASGRGSWLFLLVALVVIAAGALIRRESNWRDETLAALEMAREDRPGLLRAGMVSLAVFVFLSTAVLFNPTGIQMALDGLAAWFRPTPDSVEWSHYPLALAAYETFIVLVGLIGGVWLARRSLFARFLAVWFVAALAVTMVTPGRPASGMVTLLLPLTLLAGMALGRLLDHLAAHVAWGREGLMLAAAIPFIVGPALQLALFVNLPTVNAQQSQQMLLVFALFVLFLIAVIWAVSTTMGRGVALRGAALLGILLLGLGMLRTSMYTAYNTAPAPQEFLGGPRTARDVERVANQVLAVSHDRFGASATQPVAVDQRLEPIFNWYLRWHPRVEVRNNVTGSTAPHLLAWVPAGSDTPQPPTGYVGQRGRFISTWTPRDMDWRTTLRWLIYRDAPSVPPKVDGFMWFGRPAVAQPR